MAGKLLLAFDNPDALYLIRRYADEVGFQTQSAGAGEDICTLARETNPQAIILEAPDGQTGLKVLAALKAYEHTRQIPVIVCYDRDSDLIRCSEVAASLCQPILYRDFTAALGEAGVLPGAIDIPDQHNGH